MKSKYDQQLENWAMQHGIQDIIHNQDIFVRVDKYNKPVDSKRKIKENAVSELSKEQQKKLDELKTKMPYDETYFSVNYSGKQNIFLLRKKTPIQSMLNVWAVIIIIWALYRWYFRTSLPIWFDEFIAKPIVFLLPLYYYITKVEKTNFFEGISLNKGLSKRYIIEGIIIGLIFFATGSFGYYFRHHSFSWTSIFSSLPSSFILILLVSFATSISEEVLTRGFVLKRLFEDSKNPYTSSLYASILFFFMHIPILMSNDAILGVTLLQVMFTDLMLSLAVSFLYIESRSLYLPILIHALYNLSLYLFHS